ncbi:MAG: DUF2058 domain-containing protein [Chromatiaceae bacterium]|nr:MAG: DUF2058 domain-containing protein [Chromatiaceae bacterium]
MANSLQEQLLKAGLVSEQRLKETKAGKHKQRRKGAPPAAEAGRRIAAQAAAEKQRRDRELNRQRDEEARRKAEVVALWQLVRDSRLPRERADIAYNFTDGSALKRLYVNAEQQRGVVDGTLAIVRHDGFYALVPAAVAERCAEHDPALVVVRNRPGEDDRGNDDYAEYQVPDDLMW